MYNFIAVTKGQALARTISGLAVVLFSASAIADEVG
jgi:hypothetical protein